MDNKTKLLAELNQLAEGSDRPAAKRLREIHDDIENFIAKGVTREKIYEKLRENGYAITFESFLVTLSRLRKEKKRGKKPAATVAHTAQPPPSSTNSSNPLKALEASHKEGEFSAIPVQFEVQEKS